MPHHEVVLHGQQSLGVEGQAPIRGQGEGGLDALQVELAVAGTGAVAVPQQIVHPVAVELAAHQGGDRRPGVLSVFKQVGNLGGKARSLPLQPVPQGRMFPDQPARPRLVAHAVHLLAGMAEWAVAHIVQQGRRQQAGPVPGQARIPVFQLPQGLPGQVQHPQGMGEAARFGAVEGEKGRPQLADPAQPLEGRAVDQIDR